MAQPEKRVALTNCLTVELRRPLDLDAIPLDMPTSGMFSWNTTKRHATSTDGQGYRQDCGNDLPSGSHPSCQARWHIPHHHVALAARGQGPSRPCLSQRPDLQSSGG